MKTQRTDPRGNASHATRRVLVAPLLSLALLAGATLCAGAASAGSSATVPRTHPATTRLTITGTGPDLVEMAQRSKAVRHARITGTGPDLVQVADYGGIGR